jgi:DNA (cytosine-5)-methyltransferase 1
VRPRLLDLFCCEGGAATGYDRAGFDVTGVDIKPQPRYPFPFVQADAVEYVNSLTLLELQQYDVIHASPPCQKWADGTPDRSIHPDLIEPTRAALVATGLPYVIENVRAAPLLNRVMICGGGLGLTVGRWQLHRHRYFESNVHLLGVPCARHLQETISVVGHGTPSGMRRPGLPDPRMSDRRAVMEMPWASRRGTSEAIPPRYAEHLGWQLLLSLT